MSIGTYQISDGSTNPDDKFGFGFNFPILSEVYI
jgi:hypothetical protein